MPVNPITDDYLELKEIVLSGQFPWFIGRSTCDSFDIFGHIFLQRPELMRGVPLISSQHFDLCHEVMLQILRHNGIKPDCFYRMGANSVTPHPTISVSGWHVDHPALDHRNIVVHLTDAGGATLVGDERYEASEDAVVIFDGIKHCHELPLDTRRVVLVATFV
jgi:hypothetical protein